MRKIQKPTRSRIGRRPVRSETHVEVPVPFESNLTLFFVRTFWNWICDCGVG
jgi:hypothetical protein